MSDPVTTEIIEFRTQARLWLEENFPKSLAGRAALLLSENEDDDGGPELKRWRQRMAEQGWGCPTWPVEYGGAGLTPLHARVLNQELGRLSAFNPMHIGLGVTMVGPTILEYGTERQKREHLPPMARGELRWCLGYSEPGAGSDLAALSTKAEDVGDHWLINGQKIWTSGAHLAQWCGVLVRTDPAAKRHDGISFLLVDMDQPGVRARPISLISGASSFCETFFHDARGEKHNLLGELNNGWTVGKRLLQHERASQTGDSPSSVASEPLQAIAKAYVLTEAEGRLSDMDLRSRVTKHLMHAKAHELTIARAAVESRGDTGPSAAASVLKNSATEVAQARAELLLELRGFQGLGWDGQEFTPSELGGTRAWLASKSMSIYGGSAEIQNNIVAKRILGLPDMIKSG